MTVGDILDEVERVDKARYYLEHADVDDVAVYVSAAERNELIELLDIHKTHLLRIKVKGEVME